MRLKIKQQEELLSKKDEEIRKMKILNSQLQKDLHQ